MRYLLLMPIIITAIISLVLWQKLNAKDKINMGMKLCYWKLSYKRKFFRTLWLFPLFTIIIVLFHFTIKSFIIRCIIGLVSYILLLVQAIYNYKKWNNEEL